MGVVVQEGEAVAVAGVLIVGQHGVPQAAGLAGDGQRAVAQRDQLGQAAGLEQRGHQEQVRRGVELVGQHVVHLEVGGHLLGVLPLGPAEQVHIAALAHAQHHQLGAGVHDLRQHALHQVQALLAGQAGDHGDHRDIGVHGQAQLALQRQLVLDLGVEAVGGVVLHQRGVLLRVILLGVDAVEYAAEVVNPAAQQAVQALAVVGGLDLLGIGGADGGDLIGEHDAALHAGAHAVELQGVAGVGQVAQVQQVLDGVDGEQALVLQIVDGVDRLDVLEQLQLLVLQLVQHGDQAGLPVVAVQHVGDEIDLGQRLHHRAAEEGEALALVTAHAIDVVAAEILLVIHEIVGDAGIFQRFDADILPAPAEVDVEVQHVLHLLAPFRTDGLIKGEDDANVLAGLQDLPGQRADHVRKAAGFDERHALRCCEEYFHGCEPPF